MNTKFKLFITLVTGMYIFTSCNSETSTTTSDKKDSAMEQTSNTEYTSNKMQDMQMDNGLMGAMNSMMDKMTSMKMSGDFDIDFANMMIEHHQGAIDMSNIEVSKGADKKMKNMAQKIITMQTEEIGKLQELVKKYKPSGMEHGEGALEKAMADMKTKMSSMQMTGNTDKDFATMMISHHEGAIKMFKDEIANGMNEELKQMAKKGISDQTKEISEFKTWLSGNK